jgi:hypothetical protein
VIAFLKLFISRRAFPLTTTKIFEPDIEKSAFNVTSSSSRFKIDVEPI